MISVIQAIDNDIVLYLYSMRTLPFTDFFIGISELGRYQLILTLTTIIIITFIYYNRIPDSVGIFVAVYGAGAMILILKYLFLRPRPDIFFQAYPEIPYLSFPSAHAGLAIVFYGFCMETFTWLVMPVTLLPVF